MAGKGLDLCGALSIRGTTFKEPLLTVEVEVEVEVDRGGTRTKLEICVGFLTGVCTICVVCIVEQDSKYSLNFPLFCHYKLKNRLNIGMS